jgi:carbonic anhydrase
MQAPPGDLFICRTAGNIVPAWGDNVGGVGATIEYAVEVLTVKHIVIVGHSDCGAMKALINPEKVQHLRAIAGWIRHAERVSAVAREMHGDPDDPEFVNRLIEENVITQLDHLVTYPCVAAKMRSGNLFVHGLVFDIKTGTFRILDRATNHFLPLKAALEQRAAHVPVQV